jgi:hypothetical protein
MKLHDIHFCFGFVLGKRDKYFKDFILNLYSKFNEDKDYSRQEIQRILYQSYTPNGKMGGRYKGDFGKERCFRFIKHTIRSNKNY